MNTFLASVRRFYASSIGKKIIVAVTGVILLAYLLVHLLGNLSIFFGANPINTWGQFLHSTGLLLWVARIVLLADIGLHIVTTILLVRQNRGARPTRYACNATVNATPASRYMMWTGIVILAFVIYHILHFTVGASNEFYTSAHYVDHAYLAKTEAATGTGVERHDIQRMVIDGFRWLPASIFYMIAICLLYLHIQHGFQSVFQTTGLRTSRSWPLILCSAWAYSLFILIGNLSIPIAVLTGILKY